MPALHPGEMLREEFMKPLGLSSNALAMELRVPVTRISEIVRERRGITADTALRLARYFNMSPEFWMRLQMDFDLESAADAEESAIHEGFDRAHRMSLSRMRSNGWLLDRILRVKGPGMFPTESSC
jgi:addiction module HigA family antidote